jgi:cytochrome c oxidase subunit 1
MYATGQVLLPFFAIMTMLIAVPTGVKFFNWIGTMWGGSLTFETPMLWALGFLTTFLFGGPYRRHPVQSAAWTSMSPTHTSWWRTSTTWCSARWCFAMFAGFYFWWPKLTGRMLDETLGKVHFWMLFVGFHTTFLIQHLLGVKGMPRRYADYLPEDGFTWMNQVSSARCSPAGCLDDSLPLQRVEDKSHGALVETDDSVGLRRFPGMGYVVPPAHDTTSSRSRGSAQSVRRSTCTTPRPLSTTPRWPDKNILDALLGAPDVDHDGQGTIRLAAAPTAPTRAGDERR